MEEIWKPIIDCEGYEVSNLGNVKSLHYKNTNTEHLMKPRFDKDNYLVVHINGKTKKVHRLVAFAFVDGYDEKHNQVNHKNEIKHDNRAENLEWCDVYYNINYGSHTNKCVKSNTNNPKRSFPVIQLTLDGKFVAKHLSTKQAARTTGFCQRSIVLCCHHCKENYKNFLWIFEKEYNTLNEN